MIVFLVFPSSIPVSHTYYLLFFSNKTITWIYKQYKMTLVAEFVPVLFWIFSEQHQDLVKATMTKFIYFCLLLISMCIFESDAAASFNRNTKIVTSKSFKFMSWLVSDNRIFYQFMNLPQHLFYCPILNIFRMWRQQLPKVLWHRQ